MNVSCAWLKAVAPGLDLTPEHIARRLAMLGFPVESTLDLAAGLSGVVIGRVEEVRRHPNADRLSVCRVDGGNGVVPVVCGAPNVRAGNFHPFAPVGAVLPGNIRIKRVRIRGQESRGMLCSARELGLGSDHRGILELAGRFRPGEDFARAAGLADWRLDVEVSPNRGDLLSHVGVARELAGDEGIVLPPLAEVTDAQMEVRSGDARVEGEGVRIRIEDAHQCRRYMAAVVRGVRVGPSPEWLAAPLRAAGAQPINNVVDATNYVLLELGQPLHAFDLAKISSSEVIVQGARREERIRTLDGEPRVLEEGVLLICDPAGPLAIAGVMGGRDSEIGADTVDVLLECALFNPKSVRRVRRALGMSTDASYRFERGVDPEGLEQALKRAVSIVVAACGGRPDPLLLDACPRRWSPPVVELRPERVERLLGVGFGIAEIRSMLKRLGYRFRDVSGNDTQVSDTLRVEVPGHRSYDTLREVDLIEEIARVHGYDRFPDGLGDFRPGTVPDDPLLQLFDRLRTILVGRGFLEAHTTAFAPPPEGDVAVLNPVSAQESHLRRTMLAGLLRTVEYNFARRARDIRVFDLGTVFRPGAAGELPSESGRLGVALTGRRRPGHWSRDDVLWDEWELRGLAEQLLEAVMPAGWSVEAGVFDSDLFEDGASYLLRADNGSAVGGAGRIRKGRVDAPVWAGAVWGIELELGAGVRTRRDAVFERLPAFPAVERDLALLLSDSLPAGEVLGFLRKNGGKYLAEVSVFDVYQGGDVPAGRRSVGFRLRFQSGNRTLTDAVVDRTLQRIVRRLKEALGVAPGDATGSSHS